MNRFDGVKLDTCCAKCGTLIIRGGTPYTIIDGEYYHMWCATPYTIGDRCVGCKWRTPRQFGGQGIMCFQKDGSCPDWAIKWALQYTSKSLTHQTDLT